MDQKQKEGMVMANGYMVKGRGAALWCVVGQDAAASRPPHPALYVVVVSVLLCSLIVLAAGMRRRAGGRVCIAPVPCG